jgi:hypothetical protein
VGAHRTWTVPDGHAESGFGVRRRCSRATYWRRCRSRPLSSRGTLLASSGGEESAQTRQNMCRAQIPPPDRRRRDSGSTKGMRAEGLEPPRAEAHQDLNLARIPIPPRPHGARMGLTSGQLPRRAQIL